MFIKKCFFAVSLAGLLASSPLMAQNFNDEQKKELGLIIKDYLISNPEVLKLAIGELERREKQAQKSGQVLAIKDNSDLIFKSPKDIIAGNPKGDITLVEFFDYNCGFCKKALEDVHKLTLKDNRLRIVLKDFPVLGPDSVEASRVAIAALKQIPADKQWDFHQKVMSLKGRINGERTLMVAKEMGLDVQRIELDMMTADNRGTLNQTMELADNLKLNGTPAFVVGSEIIFGAVGYDTLHSAINNVRQCGKSLC